MNVEKLSAIQNLGYGLLNKAILYFPKRFWAPDALGLQFFGNYLVNRYFNVQANTPGAILFALYGADTALRMEKLSTAEQNDILLSPLKTAYPDTYCTPSNILITNWGQDKYSRGSYSYLPFGTNIDGFSVLAKCIANRLYFAGEATYSKAYASVHGAYESGIRAANEILGIDNN